MATVKAFFRTTTKKADKVNIRFRLTDGRSIQLFHKSNIVVSPSDFDPKKEEIKAKIICNTNVRIEFNKNIVERKNLILDLYNAQPDKTILTSKWLDNAVHNALTGQKLNTDEDVKDPSFFSHFEDFLENHKISEGRKKHYMVLYRALQRFELFKSKQAPFILSFDTLKLNVLKEFEDFLSTEHVIYKNHPDIYEAITESRIPSQRGENTIIDLFKKVRVLVNWANTPDAFTHKQITKINAFGSNGYKIKECKYGSPIYITIEERNKLYNEVFVDRPKLAIQRDIFVFQCLIGCRVGDLYKMTKANVINGAIEYIPTKTEEETKATVRVPLNQIAVDILNKYPDSEMLLPFISEQQYNKAIKEMFRLAELTRMVSIVNPTTGKIEQKPLDKVASSHLARRTFVGNLYKQVKDPNLVGSLSGHKEGSKAFARYREIDEDMKKELVKLLM
jgi:integrase